MIYPRKHFRQGIRFLGLFLLLTVLIFGCEKKEITSNQKNPAKKELIKTNQIKALGQSVASLNARVWCPKNMVPIEGGAVNSIWERKNGDPFVRKAGADRKVKTFCMDRFEFPNKFHQVPKTNVSQVEARMLCKKIGKRLCYEDEWELACSQKERAPYSYGNEKEKWRCNSDGVLVGGDEFISPAGSHPGCKNRFGVYDLNGNVSEWVARQNSGGAGVLRGGTAWATEEYGQSCFSRHMHPINDTIWNDDGFRCCKEVVTRNPVE